MIGQTVSHYRILEKLGEGGMGVVYVAEAMHLDRRCTIKVMASTTGDHNFHARVLRDARAISTLMHDHFAADYDYGETSTGGGKSQPFIVMKPVKETRLADLMHESRFTLKRAVGIVADVAGDLIEAHHPGVFHWDIKPPNIKVNEQGEVKLLDFGLAKHLQEESYQLTGPNAQTQLAKQTRSGVVVGTPLYLSPEQARGGAVDGRSDLFALGAFLYECIAGKLEFNEAGVTKTGAMYMKTGATCMPLVDPPPSTASSHTINPRTDLARLKLGRVPTWLASTHDNDYQDGFNITETGLRVEPRHVSGEQLQDCNLTSAGLFNLPDSANIRSCDTTQKRLAAGVCENGRDEIAIVISLDESSRGRVGLCAGRLEWVGRDLVYGRPLIYKSGTLMSDCPVRGGIILGLEKSAGNLGLNRQRKVPVQHHGAWSKLVCIGSTTDVKRTGLQLAGNFIVA